jgi:ABC-2 type transport system permease protein
MKSFGKLLIASLKEFSRDRTSLGFTVILPLLLVAFFGFAYGSSGSRMVVGLVGPSNSRATAATASAVTRAGGARTETGSRSQELARLHDGSIEAVMIVGTGTAKARSHVVVYYDRSNGAISLAVRALAAEIDASIAKSMRSSSVVTGPPQLVALSPISGVNGSRLDYVVPGILATAIMWLGIFAAIPLVQQREQQVLRRFSVTPLSRGRLVAAQVLSRVGVSLAQALFILLAAKLLFDVPIGAQTGSIFLSIVVVAGLALFGALCFVAIGYAIAALNATQHGAHAWAQLISMPMLLLAGVFFPIALMPGFLRPVVAVLPLTYLADAFRQTAIQGQHFAPLGVDVVVLAAWILVPMIVAARYFRWT